MSIDLHPGQSNVFSDLMVERTRRFPVVNCSRGWGKSYLGGAAATAGVYELFDLKPDVPNKNVYIIAPTYEQVIDIYYPILSYDFGLDDLAISSSKDRGRFIFENNVELRLVSYEAIERMRGKGAYLVVWDEVSSCRKGVDPKTAWESIIQPCIVTRWSQERADEFGAKSPGRALMISTPEGYNFFQEMHTYSETDPEWGSYTYDYTTSPYLSIPEIQKLRKRLDPIKFASEYLASFKESGNSVFYCFDRKKHIVEVEDLQPEETVHVCIDFNVGIQASAVFCVRGGQMQFIDEFKGHPDTETLASMIKAKYKGHKIYGYPDPSGRSRKTSAAVGRTDFSILEAHGITCLAHKAAPPIVDSAASVNKKLLNAAGDVDMLIHPRCVGLIQSLERTKWIDKNPETAVIDKSEGVEHFSDGVRYATEYLFPIHTGQKRTSRGFNF